MSCVREERQEAENNPSLLGKDSAYGKAIQAMLEAKPEDITDQITYMDSKCHGCVVGHILKVTDGLNYQKYNEDQRKRMEEDVLAESLVRRLMKKNFGVHGVTLDMTLSAIHDDYICDHITFEEMQDLSIECLEGFRDEGMYEYTSVADEEDDDDYDEDDE